MKKLAVRLVLLLLVIVIGLYFVRNFIARRSVEAGVEAVTGFPMKIAAVDVALFRSQLTVTGLTLQNPPDFPAPLFVEMPRLFVDYRLPSLLTGHNHIHNMVIHIDHLHLIKNKDGVSNVQQLKSVTARQQPAPAENSQTKYQLDRLTIRVGKVTIQDFSRAKPTERTLTLNLDRTYQNISDSTDITRLVLMSIAGNVPLPDLGINTAELQQSVGNVVGAAAETIEKTGKGVFDALKKAIPQK